MVQGDRTQVALNLENDRLTAVAAAVADGRGSSRLEVRSWLSVDRPTGIDGADPASLGRWVGDELKKAGMHRAAKAGGVVFAVPRGEVVLKRVTFPPGPQMADLPGMVRLQMVRQLTVSPETAAIDFVPITPGAGESNRRGPGGGAPAGAVSVLAGALQGDRLEWREAIARAAGVKVRRVALRSAGAGALLADAAIRRGGSTLGIALGSGSTEFAIVEDGQLVFARATDLYRPDQPEEIESFAQKVAVEAKRTWMSYRVAAETTEIEAVVVLGADEAARQVAAQCRESLALPSEATDYPGFVEVPSTMSPAERTVMAPLVGLLAETALGRETMDFANPRKAPDLAARRRQAVLLAALLAIVGGGTAMTAARLDLQRRRAAVDALAARYDGLAAEYSDTIRTKARADHVEQWMAARVDWLAHLGELTSMLPDARIGVLERLEGHGEATTEFGPSKVKWYADGRWEPKVAVAFDITGSVKHREVADSLRKMLVEDSEYQVESKGPDTPDRFDLILRTDRARPRGREGRLVPGGGA